LPEKARFGRHREELVSHFGAFLYALPDHSTFAMDAASLRPDDARRGRSRGRCRIDASTGELLESIDMPAGTGVSGLEGNGRDVVNTAAAGGAANVRAVQRGKPK
jgi:hypothetical protein